MGFKLFGGDSTTQQTDTQYINETSLGLSDINAPVAVGGGSVNVTDFGAVQSSLDAITSVASQSLRSQENTAYQAIKANQGGLDASLDFAKGAILAIGAATEEAQATARGTNATLADAIKKAADATRSDSSQVLSTITKYGAWVVIAIAAAYVLKGSKLL